MYRNQVAALQKELAQYRLKYGDLNSSKAGPVNTQPTFLQQPKKEDGDLSGLSLLSFAGSLSLRRSLHNFVNFSFLCFSYLLVTSVFSVPF